MPITTTPLHFVNPDPSTAKAHHVCSPPTSFKNPWPSAGPKPGLGQIFNLRFGSHPEKTNIPIPQGPNGTRSSELVQILEPDWGVDQPEKLRATWLGHASVLVEFPTQGNAERGIRVLFDPLFSERAGPTSYLGPRRFTPPPCTIEELPDVDVVCISHSHYDHLDFNAVDALFKKQARGSLRFLVPLGLKGWFEQHVDCAGYVEELDWWDGREVKVEGVGSVEVRCTPCQHGSARTPFDTNTSLWSSWAVSTSPTSVPDTPTLKRANFFHAGDTALRHPNSSTPCPVFSQIGATLGPFDLAFVPIGCYNPPSVMGGVHASPQDSLEICRMVRASVGVGMHYGTLRGGISGAFEDVGMPGRDWKRAALDEGEGRWLGGGVEGAEEGRGGKIDVGRLEDGKWGVGLCHVGETVAV